MPIEGDDEAWARDADDGNTLARDADVRRTASEAVSRGTRRRGTGRRPAVDQDAVIDAVRADLDRAAGRDLAPRYEERLEQAAEHFGAERYLEAARILKRLAQQVPTVPAVRELYGLTLYRQGKWREAAAELEAFRLLTGSVEQHPVLADCYRALAQPAAVEDLWRELGAASPDAATTVEGRIVTAGARADQGDLPGAIRLLSTGWRAPKRPQDHHLRRAYALADLYERAGEPVRARQLFAWVADHDPDLADARRRARQLG